MRAMGRQIVIVLGLLFVACAVGLWLGSRISMAWRPAMRVIATAAPQPRPVSGAPIVGNAAPCADIRNAAALVGKAGCVAGLVVRTFSSRSGNTFLDFCQEYRSCPFTSVIFASDKDKFGDLASLQGKRVEIRGDVTNYQDHAEIIIHDPQQVRSAP